MVWNSVFVIKSGSFNLITIIYVSWKIHAYSGLNAVNLSEYFRWKKLRVDKRISLNPGVFLFYAVLTAKMQNYYENETCNTYFQILRIILERNINKKMFFRLLSLFYIIFVLKVYTV